jgi:DNA-binding transcriptional LysR family regulator
MQFEALKVFCDVARLRSFSQAAAANRVSQSAASQIVLMLERRLGGVQLIDRSTRPLGLTDVGQLYYEGCKGLVEQYQELEAQVRTAGSRHDAQVIVAAIYSVGLGDMGQLVERFRADNPGAQVHVEYLHPDRVYEKVQDGTADFGLVSFPRKSRDLIVLPWRDEEMVLACAPQHPLARARSVKPAQLAGEKFVGFDRELVIRRQIDRFLREHNAAVDVVMEFDNIENIKKAVEINAGVALLPEPTCRREVQGRTLVAVPLAAARLVRPLGILYRRQHKLNFATVRFMELLRQDATLNGVIHTNGDRRRFSRDPIGERSPAGSRLNTPRRSHSRRAHSRTV